MARVGCVGWRARCGSGDNASNLPTALPPPPANVDWLHGGAELLLTFTNLFIVLGTRGAIRKAKTEQAEQAAAAAGAGERRPGAVALPADE